MVGQEGATSGACSGRGSQLSTYIRVFAGRLVVHVNWVSVTPLSRVRIVAETDPPSLILTKYLVTKEGGICQPRRVASGARADVRGSSSGP